MSLEYCFRCGDPTGRAGRGDDSIYIGDEGPFCEECYAKSPTASMTSDEKATAMVEAFRPLAEIGKPVSVDHLELAKAIFAAGFRLGHKYGQDAAVAFDWGTQQQRATDARSRLGAGRKMDA